MNQEIIGRKPKYVQMCIWRLKRWQEFMEVECGIENIELVEAVHIKRYIQYRQQLGNEKPITFEKWIYPFFYAESVCRVKKHTWK